MCPNCKSEWKKCLCIYGGHPDNIVQITINNKFVEKGHGFGPTPYCKHQIPLWGSCIKCFNEKLMRTVEHMELRMKEIEKDIQYIKTNLVCTRMT